MKRKIFYGTLCSLLAAQGIAINENVTFAQTKEQPSVIINKEEVVRLIIQYNAQDRDYVLESLKNINNTFIKYEYTELLNGVAVETTVNNFEKIKKLDKIVSVEISRKIKPTLYTAKQLAKTIQSSPNYKNDGRGMVIALIDSGLDTKHKDMRLDEGVEPKIKTIKDSVNGTYTKKVPYGFNYVEGNDELVDATDKPHGMHLAGILAGNATDKEVEDKTGIDGVAPNAQLLAYKIFSDNPKKFKAETEDAAYAAMEDAVKRGADVISLSVGYYDSGLPGNAYYKIAEKAAEKGIVITAAIGNAATSSATTSYDLKANDAFNIIDTATTVGVAATPYVLGVGSVRNTSLVEHTLQVDDIEVGYFPIGDSKVVNSNYTLAYLEDNNEEYIKSQDLKGKIAVVKRGTADYRSLIRNIKLRDAAGIILVNSNRTINRDYYMSHLDYIRDKDLFTFSNVWGVTVSGETGEKLINKIKESNNKILIEDKKLIKSRKIVNVPEISGFSSWGPTVNLELKPEIVAPGEDIYSTLNNNTYGSMSGTSMASPIVAGASTLLLPKVRAMNIPENFKQLDLLKLLLMNTAIPVIDRVDSSGNNLENSPRQQGAGLMQLEDAMNAEVIAYHNKKGGVELKEIGTEETFEITLQNLGDKEQIFDISQGAIITSTNIPVEKTNANGKEIVNEVHSKKIDGATLTSSTNQILLQPKETKTVSFKLKLPEINDQFAEGYIYFKDKNGKHPTLSVPYFGFVGDWTKERIVDAPVWEEDTKTKLTAVMSTYKNAVNERYIELGRQNFADANSIINPNDIAISNTNNGYLGNAYLRFALLRDLVNYEIDIVTEQSPEAQSLKRIDTGRLATRYRHIDYFEDETYRSAVITPKEHHIWDGSIYNTTTGEMEKAKEGQYYFRIKVKNKEQGKPQYTYLPIKIDNQKPEIKTINKEKLDSDKEITLTVSDNNKVAAVFAKLDGKEVALEKVMLADGNVRYKLKDVEIRKDATNKLTLEVMDIAGNVTKLEETLAPYSIIFDNIDKLEKSKNLYEKITATLAENVASVEVTLDDKVIEVEKNNNKLAFSLENENVSDGPHTLKVILKDKDGTIVDTEIYNFVRDFTKPKAEFEVEYEDEDEEDVLKADENGKITIKGKVQDNITANKNLKITYYAAEFLTDTITKKYKKESIIPNDDGSFELNLFKSDFPTAVLIDIVDEKGNKFSKRFNTAEEGFEEGTEHIENPVLMLNTGLNSPVYFGEEAVEERHDLELKDGKYIFTFSFKSDEEDYKIAINDGEKKVFTEDDEGEIKISYPIELKEQFNVVDVNTYDSNDKLIRNVKYHIYLDATKPVLEIANKVEKTSEEGIEGLLLANKKGDLVLQGTAEDNGIYWALNINNSLVERGGVWREYGNNKKQFNYKISNLKDNDVVNIKLVDRFGNEIKQNYKIKIDDTEPVINVINESLEEGKTYFEKVLPEIIATDRDGEEVILTAELNGQSYNIGDTITTLGNNILKIVATDSAGNLTEKEISFVVKSNLTAKLNKVEFTEAELENISSNFILSENSTLENVEILPEEKENERTVFATIVDGFGNKKKLIFVINVIKENKIKDNQEITESTDKEQLTENIDEKQKNNEGAQINKQIIDSEDSKKENIQLDPIKEEIEQHPHQENINKQKNNNSMNVLSSEPILDNNNLPKEFIVKKEKTEQQIEQHEEQEKIAENVVQELKGSDERKEDKVLARTGLKTNNTLLVGFLFGAFALAYARKKFKK